LNYYYDPESKSNVKTDSGKFITYKLKDETENEADLILSKIQSHVRKITHTTRDLEKHWNGVSNFGWVFVDYKIPDEAYWNIIGAGYLDLFEIIKNEYSCLVLTKTMQFNMRDIETYSYRVLIINIEYFQKFAKAITRKNFVNLFMYKFTDPELEKIIRRWLIEKPDKLQLILDAKDVSISDITTLVEKYKVTNLKELSDLLDNATRILKSRIEENYKLFDEKLIEFETMMNEEKVETDGTKKSNLENRLKKHLKENPWIIDFTYNEKDVDEKTHRHVDVLVVGSYLGYKKGLIIELKRPDVPTIKEYRDRDAITASVGNAFSQLIQYTKEIVEKTAKDDTKTFFEGLIIIGNDMNDFIPYFNQFLHNVSVKTYREIHDDARKRLQTFADGMGNQQTNEPTGQKIESK
jgi:hypothetical protein